MVLNQPTLFLLAAFVWLTLVTIWLYRTNRHYSRLTKTAGSQDLRSILDELLKRQSLVDEHIGKVEEGLKELEKSGEAHVQKVGVMRFNPFAETGGDQSFALALLDKEDNGVVLLSLHGREGTRIYVKPVKRGKSRYELSKEEKQAITEARKGSV